jgi:hypothetical protein
MEGVSPVNEERHKPISDHRPLVADTPGQKNAARRASASGYHVTDGDTATTRIGDELRQVSSLRSPRDKPRLGQIVDLEFPRTGRPWLVRIRANDLEVRRRPERDQRIASALAWMLPAGRCVNSQQSLNVRDTGGQIGSRVNEMIDRPKQRRRVTCLRE